jgi:hypothetical protein
MFDRECVGVRIADVKHRKMEKDDAEVALVELSCEISPLTAALAGELHPFVKNTLFTMSEAEVNSLLAGASFNLSVPPQAVVLRMAPDQKQGSFTLAETKISGFRASRSKKTQAWTWHFVITCSPASEHQLAQIVECYLKTRYLTFANAEASLFDDAPKAVDETRGRGLTAGEASSLQAH